MFSTISPVHCITTVISREMFSTISPVHCITTVISREMFSTISPVHCITTVISREMFSTISPVHSVLRWLYHERCSALFHLFTVLRQLYHERCSALFHLFTVLRQLYHERCSALFHLFTVLRLLYHERCSALFHLFTLYYDGYITRDVQHYFTCSHCITTVISREMFSTISPVHTVLRLLDHERCSALFNLFTLYYDGYITRDVQHYFTCSHRITTVISREMFSTISPVHTVLRQLYHERCSALFHLFTLYYDSYITRDVQHYFTCSLCITTVISREMFSTISPVHTVLRQLYHERCSALFHLFTLHYDGYITRDVQHYFTCSLCMTTVISREMFSTISPVHTVLRQLYHERCSALFHLFTVLRRLYHERCSALFHLFTLYYDGYITRDVQHYFTCSHCITTVISREMFSTISPVHSVLRRLYHERCSALFHLFTLHYDGYITRDVQHYFTCSLCITTVLLREMFSTISHVHTALRRLYHERCSALFHLFTLYYDGYITRDVQHYFTCSHCITTVISRRDVQHYFTCSHCITTVISREMFSTISPVHEMFSTISLRRLYHERCSALFHLFTLYYDRYITRDVQHYFTCSHCITTVISREMFSTISHVHSVLRQLYHERCSALFHLFTLYYDSYITRDVQHYFTCSLCITTVISREMFSTISPVHSALRLLYHERCSALFHLFTLYYDGYITRDVQHYFTCSLCITTVISREMFSTISPVHSVLRRLYHERCSALFHLFTLYYDSYITRDVQHYFTCSLCITTVISREMFSTISPVHTALRQLFHKRCTALFHLFTLYYDSYITRDVQHYFTCSLCITTVISREMFSTISHVHTALRQLYHERCSALFHMFTLYYDSYITRDVQHYFTCSLCITTVISREMFSTISPVHSVLRRLYHERCSALFHLFTLHYDGYITRDVQHYFTCSLCITTVISQEMFSTISPVHTVLRQLYH